MDDAEYQKEYDKAALALEEAAQATTSRDDSGRFAKVAPAEVEKPEPEKPEVKPDPEVKPEPETKPEEEAKPDPLEEIRAKLAKTEKALKDTQSWGTKNAQELAQLKRESDERKRQAERPQILDANPELEAAIKFVVPEIRPTVDPAIEALETRNQIIETAHPGIFHKDVDPELVKGILTRFDALGADIDNPLACIREITAEKLAHTERQIGKRFAAETAKAVQKNAMTVPGAGGGGVKNTTIDTDLAAAERINNMSPAEFERERRRVMGY